jgi:hypothetical protein
MRRQVWPPRVGYLMVHTIRPLGWWEESPIIARDHLVEHAMLLEGVLCRNRQHQSQDVCLIPIHSVI